MLEVNKYNQNSEFSVVVTALTSRPQEIPSRVHALFLQQLEMAPPTKLQREVMLEALTRDYSVEVGLDIAELAKETAGFVLGDLVRLVSSGYDIAFKSLLEYWYGCYIVINGAVYNVGVGTLFLYCCSKSLEVGGAGGRGLWSDAHVHGVVISMAHMQQALDQLRSSHSDAIGAPKVRHYYSS